ncbi:hypothetical protein SNE40_009525 [Patella caerulea]|uniref:Uncharacterized protein n=1 Tax=Patella caerulea TaxID=87958 RepID=A0AAN8JVN2_PATCE
MAEEIVKHKIAQRNGHRTSVKRIISKLNDFLKIEVDESAYLENRDTLIRYKSKLAEKLKTLTKLDEEIMEVSHADKLSDEIEVADEISEHIASYSAKTNRRIQELDLKFENIRPKSVSENSVKDSQNSPSDNSDKPNSDVISVHDSDWVIGDKSLTQNVSGSQNITGKATHSQVRLPKLTLQSFAGDYAQWQPFLDTFENSIHNNHQLSDVDKFNYLKSFLNGDARTSIAGLSLTLDNYSNAIAILKRKYGNRQRIISRHTADLVNIPVISDVNNYRDLRRLYDKLEANIQSLDAMGIQSSAYGTILSSVIMSKLPHELKVVINREVKDRLPGNETYAHNS